MLRRGSGETLGHTMEDEDLLSPNLQGCHMPGPWSLTVLASPHAALLPEDRVVLGPASPSPERRASPEPFQHAEGQLLVAQALLGACTLPWAGCARPCS